MQLKIVRRALSNETFLFPSRNNSSTITKEYDSGTVTIFLNREKKKNGENFMIISLNLKFILFFFSS